MCVLLVCAHYVVPIGFCPISLCPLCVSYCFVPIMCFQLICVFKFFGLCLLCVYYWFMPFIVSRPDSEICPAVFGQFRWNFTRHIIRLLFFDKKSKVLYLSPIFYFWVTWRDAFSDTSRHPSRHVYLQQRTRHASSVLARRDLMHTVMDRAIGNLSWLNVTWFNLVTICRYMLWSSSTADGLVQDGIPRWAERTDLVSAISHWSRKLIY